jgi:hypothetical protein
VAGAVLRFDRNGLREVQPGLVRDDGGLQTGCFEFFRDVEGGVVVFLRTGDVGGSGQRLQCLTGEGRIGYSEELAVDRCLFAEVLVAEQGARDGGGLGRQGKCSGNKRKREPRSGLEG